MKRLLRQRARDKSKVQRKACLEVEALEDRLCMTVTLGVGANVNIAKMLGNQAEETIAIVPAAAVHGPLARSSLFAAAVQFNLPPTTNAGLFAAQNAAGWVARTMATGDTGQAGGDSLPAAFADPSAASDHGQFGNLFLTYLTPLNGFLQNGQTTAASGNLTLTDTSHNWATNQWAGDTVKITSGGDNGDSNTIVSNTATQITVKIRWLKNPAAGDTYSIYTPSGSQSVALVMSINAGVAFSWVKTFLDGVDHPAVAAGPGTLLTAGLTTGGNTATTLNDTTQNWTVNQWAGQEVLITGGPGIGQRTHIISNTATQLTVNPAWTTIPPANDLYQIDTGPGSVWVVYRSQAGNIKASGAPVDGSSTVGNFITPESAQNSNGTGSPNVQIGPNGQVMVAYLGAGVPAQLYTDTDPDGLYPAKTFDPAKGGIASNPTSSQVAVVNALYKIAAQNKLGISAYPVLAWDRTGKFHAGTDGRVYLIYTDLGPSGLHDDTDILRILSNDSGATWSPSITVNDASAKSQFLPWAAVDQTTGYLAVSWYDARNDPNNATAQIYGTVSSDGGASFLANVKIGAQLSNAANAGYNFDFGDYTGLDFFGNVFYPAWADDTNSTGDNPDGGNKFDIYTAAVTVTTSIPSSAGPSAFQVDRMADPARAFSLDPRIDPKFSMPAASLNVDPITVLAVSRLPAQGMPPNSSTDRNTTPAELGMLGAPGHDPEAITGFMAPTYLAENDLPVSPLRHPNLHRVVDALFEADSKEDGAMILRRGADWFDDV